MFDLYLPLKKGPAVGDTGAEVINFRNANKTRRVVVERLSDRSDIRHCEILTVIFVSDDTSI